MAKIIVNGTMYDYPGAILSVDSEDSNEIRSLLALLLRGQSAVYMLHGGVTTVDVYGCCVVCGICFGLKLTATIPSNSDRDDFTKYTFVEEWSNGFTFDAV